MSVFSKYSLYKVVFLFNVHFTVTYKYESSRFCIAQIGNYYKFLICNLFLLCIYDAISKLDNLYFNNKV